MSYSSHSVMIYGRGLVHIDSSFDSYIIQTVQTTLRCTKIIWYDLFCPCIMCDLFSQFQTERFIRWDIPRPCSVSYWRIQWDDLCLWTDRHWKNIHNARYESQLGDCGWVRMTNNLRCWCANDTGIWILSRSQEWSWITRCYTKLLWAHISTHCQNRESTVPHSSLISGDLPSKAPSSYFNSWWMNITGVRFST